MDKDETNSISQQEQIRRYLSGEMTATEMYALEKQALQDPFLADAIEGMASIEENKLKSDLVELRSRLAEKTEGRIVRLPRRVSWGRIAVAAAIFAIAILSTVVLVNRQLDSNQLAINKEEQVRKSDSAKNPEESAVADRQDTGTTAPDESLNRQIEDRQKKSYEETNKIALTSPVPVEKSKKDRSDEKKPEALAEVQKAEASKIDISHDVLESKAAGVEIKPSVVKSTSNEAFLRPANADEKTNPNRLYFFTGKVTNAEQKPVSFANIAVKNANSLTYTDAKGNFRLFSADSVLNVDIKSVGYLTNSVVLNYNQPQHQLVLNSLPPKTKKFKSSDKKVSVIDHEKEDSLPVADTGFVSTEPVAEPVDGWGLYHLYLLNNVRPQRGTDGKNIEGSVVLSFLVNNMGWLSDFKVEKSLSTACDREALRLVREGPKWELYNTEKAIRVKVTVVF
ncbi:carboxypeptidase-like regulatory domain-containing protein [Pollutibacter soli]|uniref:carboxypeptidase-like regulatory domain-containing protein n=1 Tax=Pollutibacter soli TaxID=3034157 RepID=UPI003013EBB4